MDNDEAILAELRKISAWADMQRKATKWTLIFIAVFIPALIVFGIVMESRLKASMEDVRSPDKAEKTTWSDVDWRTRRGDLDQAIKIGEELIQKTPQYAEGHHRLASAYLAAGKIEQARGHFAEAFRLFPSEENEKLLIAIDKRRTSSAAGPNRRPVPPPHPRSVKVGGAAKKQILISSYQLACRERPVGDRR